VVISVAILASAFVSLTVTPMLASRFLRDQHALQLNALQRFAGFVATALDYPTSSG
jgi:multidrug efflux pump subunit AcrB